MHHNKQPINLKIKKYPVFLGSIMLHFMKSDNAFARVALELKHANKDVKKLM